MEIMRKIDNEIEEILEKEKKDYIDEIFLFSLKELLEISSNKINLNNDRILQSETIENKNFSIYTTVINRSEILFYEKILFPIFEDDIKSKKSIIMKNGKLVLDRIFINIAYKDIESLINKIYKGSIKIDGKTYDIKLEITLVNDYLNKITEIHNLFVKNKIFWKTVNLPFVYKFFDINIIDFPKELFLGAIYEEYNIECDDFEIEKDLILVWNLKKENVNSEIFIRPISERINYEYRVNFTKERKILLDVENEIDYVYKYNKGIVFVLKEKIDDNLVIFELINSTHFEKDSEFLYGIYNNKNTFIQDIERTKDGVLGYLEEINKFSEIVNMKDISFNNNGYNEVIFYELNKFNKNEFQIKNKRKKIYLISEGDEENIFFGDVVSYLVSELNFKMKEFEFLPVIERK